ncbi:hypothetical protein GGR57DRAFT_444740 [Xylariaceae sp. FL1272]|nr:hypothetical protein GGR57DRAFT_444740 [Xylariaceae sp. FL1272]
MAATSLNSLFGRLSLRNTLSSPLPRLSPKAIATAPTAPCHLRSIHMTSPRAAKSGGAAKGGKPQKKTKKRSKNVEGPDPRIVNLKSSMPRAVPAPLRFARNRALRHWTIHRAWLLYQNKERTRRATELERMYQSMHNACEELRNTSGPGLREEGYLYRVALEKHGVYGHNGIPIEYARAQTETPARTAWNHEWTR